jgi:hypothetical protein
MMVPLWLKRVGALQHKSKNFASTPRGLEKQKHMGWVCMKLQ